MNDVLKECLSKALNEGWQWVDDDDYEGDKYSLVGQDGNAYALMGYTARCMKECGLRNEVSEMHEKATSGDYNNLICVCDEYIQRCNEIARNSIDESCGKKPKGKLQEGWRGCDNIEMEYYNDWADPSLIYDGRRFNYWDIEDALWGDFLEETGYADSQSEDPRVEKEFDEYCQYRAEDYLNDVIAGGYFKDGSTDWRDR